MSTTLKFDGEIVFDEINSYHTEKEFWDLPAQPLVEFKETNEKPFDGIGRPTQKEYTYVVC